MLKLAQIPANFSRLPTRLGIQGRARNKLPGVPDVKQAIIQLGLAEENRACNDLGSTFCEPLDQVRVNIARPRPTADVGNTLIVDGDHGDTIARVAARQANAQVINPGFQRRKRAPGKAQRKCKEHHAEAERYEPVLVEKLAFCVWHDINQAKFSGQYIGSILLFQLLTSHFSALC